MSVFGTRDAHDEGAGASIFDHLTANVDGETMCGRMKNAYLHCKVESQELDVMYDCRSRYLDLKECEHRTKQTIWLMRENVVTIRNREAFADWSQKYDEDFGAPPLLEAVDKVRQRLTSEGGPEALHPTHFKDPQVY
jgi:hypothetical protein